MVFVVLGKFSHGIKQGQCAAPCWGEVIIPVGVFVQEVILLERFEFLVEHLIAYGCNLLFDLTKAAGRRGNAGQEGKPPFAAYELQSCSYRATWCDLNGHR